MGRAAGGKSPEVPRCQVDARNHFARTLPQEQPIGAQDARAHPADRALVPPYPHRSTSDPRSEVLRWGYGGDAGGVARAQRVKGSPWPTGEPCQLELLGRSVAGIDPHPWEGQGGGRRLSGERFGLGEPTWAPRAARPARESLIGELQTLACWAYELESGFVSCRLWGGV